MLVLLPPSESKTAPREGPPATSTLLASSVLGEHRARVLEALVAASRRPDALTVLGAGPSLADEVARNRALTTAPAAPARDVYSGVLYAAAGLDDRPPAALERAQRSVRTVSALWGLVGPGDAIPAYRLSMGTDLPGIGRLSTSWRAPLAAVLDGPAADRLVVDCRSAAYAAAWRAPGGGPGTVPVTVLREAAGRRTVVSHAAKHTRGLLTRHLMTRSGPAPTTPEELLGAAGELVGTVLLDAGLATGPRGAPVLSLVVR